MFPLYGKDQNNTGHDLLLQLAMNMMDKIPVQTLNSDKTKMENNIPGQRTTLCINETFHFLESPEYVIPESTCSHGDSFHKRTISDSNIKGHNPVLSRNSTKIDKIQEQRKDENGFIEQLERESADFNCNLTTESVQNQNSSHVIKSIDQGIKANQHVETSRGDNQEFKADEDQENKEKNNLDVAAEDDNDSCKQLKGDNHDFQHIKGGNQENRLDKRDNRKRNSWLLKNEVVNDNDSGCVAGFFVVESEVPCDSDNEVNILKGGGGNENTDDTNMINKVVIGKQDLKLDNLVSTTNVNGCEDTLNEEFDEVVRLRPKSVASPNNRRGTTQIVSDAFGFLKELDDSEEANIRRSSGYKSSYIPDEVSMVTDVIDKSIQNNILNNSQKQNNGCPIKKGSVSGNQEVDKQSKSMRRQKSQKDVKEDEISGDSSDEDTGIYNESFRNSCWICVDDSRPVMQESIHEVDENGQDEDKNKNDDVFYECKSPPITNGITNGLVSGHKRSDSITTTASESEFKRSFKARRKCFVQRNDSQQEYERMSCKVFENERKVVLEKQPGDSGFGLHILDTHPVIVSGVDEDSPAYRAGIKEGQILLMVNGVSVLEANHDRIISLVQQRSQSLQVEVANTDIHFIRDMQKPVLSGYLYKQKQSTFVRSWKKRFCVLRQDNCLYYFKNEGDVDPLGAIPMMNYTVSRHQDSSKENCFKAEKFGAKTYYFSVDSREEMAKWVGAMNEAAFSSKKRKESWMDVTSHNVGLPALEVRKAECSGYLMKCGRTTRTWQKRYCILKDACIYYYKNLNSAQAQGMAHLHGYTLTDYSKKFSFILKPPEAQMKQFIFTADNDTDKKRWVDALTRSINRWIKVD